MQRLERIGAKIVASITEWFGHANKMEATAMLNGSRIKQHVDVRGSDGRHVRRVLGVENDRIVVASGGMDPTIDIAIVDCSEGCRRPLTDDCGRNPEEMGAPLGKRTLASATSWR